MHRSRRRDCLTAASLLAAVATFGLAGGLAGEARAQFQAYTNISSASLQTSFSNTAYDDFGYSAYLPFDHGSWGPSWGDSGYAWIEPISWGIPIDFPIDIPAPCEAVTAARCDEQLTSDWWQSSCGVAELERMRTDANALCNQIYATQSTAARQAGDATNLVAVPQEMPVQGAYQLDRDYIASAQIAHYQGPAPVKATGLTSAFSGNVSRFRAAMFEKLLYTPAQSSISISPALHIFLERYGWEENGNAVASCPEYVYERYYDYSQVEDAVSAAGEDYRRVVDQAFPVLADGVTSRSGVTRWNIPWSPEAQPKNVFFTYNPVYPKETAPYTFTDATILPRLEQGRAAYVHDLAWHRRMDTALAGQDDLLYALAQKQRDFVRLLEERAAVYKRYIDFQSALSMAIADCDRKTIPVIPLWRWQMLIDPDPVVYGPRLIRTISPGVLDSLVVTQPSQLAVSSEISSIGISARNIGLIAGPQMMALSSAVDEPSAVAALDTSLTESLAGIGEMHVMSSGSGEGGGWGPWGEDGLPSVTGGSCDGFAMLLAWRPEAARRVAERLHGIDARIEEALHRADDYGCLDVLPGQYGLLPSACDWNPELFVREVSDQFTSERERDFRRCQTMTGDTFDRPSHPAHNATAQVGDSEPIVTYPRAQRFLAPYQSDYTHSTEELDEFMAMVEDWAKSIDFQRDPVSGRPIPGHQASDRDSLGNSTFGVDYGYGAEWKMENLPTLQNGNVDLATALCDVKLRAGARFDAKGTIFGQEIPLVDASADIRSEKVPAGRRGGYDVKFKIFDVDILAGQGSGSGEMAVNVKPIKFNVAKAMEKRQEVAAFTFPVAGIPVVVRAGVAGKVGLDFGVDINLLNVCPRLESTVNGHLTPFAQLDVYVSGGVQLAIVEIGLQIDLTLLRIDLPFTLAFRLYVASSDSNNTLMIDAKPKLELILKTLSGQLRAYLRFPIGSPIYIPLFGWDGVELGRTTLFEPKGWNYPLGRVALGLAFLGAH